MRAKGELEFGQWPALILDDGKILTQSIAILRFVGAKFGYYTQDAGEAYQIDSTVDHALDILNAFIDIFLHTPDVIKREEKEKAFWETKLANMLGPLEKRIENKQYFAANRITIADFFVASIAADYWMNPNNKNYEKCKEIAS